MLREHSYFGVPPGTEYCSNPCHHLRSLGTPGSTWTAPRGPFHPLVLSSPLQPCRALDLVRRSFTPSTTLTLPLLLQSLWGLQFQMTRTQPPKTSAPCLGVTLPPRNMCCLPCSGWEGAQSMAKATESSFGKSAEFPKKSCACHPSTHHLSVRLHLCPCPSIPSFLPFSFPPSTHPPAHPGNIVSSTGGQTFAILYSKMKRKPIAFALCFNDLAFSHSSPQQASSGARWPIFHLRMLSALPARAPRSSGSQPGAALPPRGRVAVCEDVFVVIGAGDATGTWWAKARVAAT